MMVKPGCYLLALAAAVRGDQGGYAGKMIHERAAGFVDIAPVQPASQLLGPGQLHALDSTGHGCSLGSRQPAPLTVPCESLVFLCRADRFSSAKAELDAAAGDKRLTEAERIAGENGAPCATPRCHGVRLAVDIFSVDCRVLAYLPAVGCRGAALALDSARGSRNALMPPATPE